MKSYLKYSIFIVLMLFILPSNAFALDGVPKGAIYFSDSGVLSNDADKENKNLFTEILKGKQSDVITAVTKLGDADFASTDIIGDLDNIDGKSGSLWTVDLNTLQTKTAGSTYKIRRGSTTYNLFIPPGRSSGGKTINTAIINNAIAGIETYQKAIKEAVLAGTMLKSYNTYTIYSKDKIPVVDILEDEKKDGRKTGKKIIKSAGGTMNYSLDIFYSPLFGKMDSTAIGKADQAFWETKIPTVKLDHVSGDKVKFTLNADYSSFLEEYKVGNTSLTLVKDGTVGKADGVKAYTPKYTKVKVKPKSMVDGAIRLVVPSVFTKKDGSVYNLNEAEKGYKTVGDIKLHIANNMVYDKDGSKGDFESFGIDVKSLVIGSITLDKDGKYSKDGKIVGAVIPLWFKEVVINTNKSKDKALDKSYITGRTVKMGNDFSGKITLDAKNKDLFAIDSKGNGKMGAKLRHFGFAENAKYADIASHVNLETTPDKFSVNITFEDTENVKGFAINRNNWYISDPDLLKWLKTDEAKAMTNVKAEELHSFITGKFDVISEELSFEDWNRLAEIRDELDKSLASQLMTIIRVITMVFGVLIIFYSITLVLAYWIDIFNVLMEFSILNMLTNKRLYPISTKEDLEYITYSKGDVKYVTFWNVLFIMICGIAVGLVFIYTTPILEFLSYAYYKITSWVGVI